ncbi:pentatricopeptide repeat-containing protein At5g13270, chloroplastic-like [Hibiscus syriacus]|uniref:pentatricopeptide repeat-containing protein At5g13270, chloroplastic-like n=1 Tax=Hibiscus syriacus TaxID=106335 RepID=UPI0019244419|nr:pentatricopeptide repeat-containing protein At5g13270, chloroplastic-like [Hibiscus syriacus]
MYSSCGLLEDDVLVFDGIEKPGLVAWSSMLSAYVKNGFEKEGLYLFLDMVSKGIELDALVFSVVIKACSNLEQLNLGSQLHGKEFHSLARKLDVHSDPYVTSALIDMYSKCGMPKAASRVFERVEDPESLCNSPVHLHMGMQAEAYIIKRGLLSHPMSANGLIQMYSKCGQIAGANSVFKLMPEKSSSSWTSIISAKVEHGHLYEALTLFNDIRRRNKLVDSSTLKSILKAWFIY